MTFENMVGRTMLSVTGGAGDYEMVFRATDGAEFRFEHYQDCCENVLIEDVAGDISDLIGSPMVMAESVDNPEPPEVFDASNHESFTWTFYKFRTMKGDVTVRWLGSSNGYYGESVDFSEKLPEVAK